jgi:predicted nuclease of restriction endonuclease-like (RecB) superfamily
MAKRKNPGKRRTPTGKAPVPVVPGALLEDVRSLIQQTRQGVAQAVNAALVLLYWQVGQRIHTAILQQQRATYGEEVISHLAGELTREFGHGFSRPNLFRMVRFAEVFPDREIVSTLSGQLGWSHLVEIIPLPDAVQRDFYAEMCRVERWSVRTLRQKIGGLLYERTALSRKPAELARQELAALRDQDRLTPDLVFRDPYLLDFLGLADTYSESDLEMAILRELESFILELGEGFAFVARQKRMVIDKKDYYLDLLFYHRKLRRLVAVELKLEPFEAAHKGQLELYLRWLEKHEQQPGEESPLGLILCSAKSEEQVELLQLGRSGIHVAAYLTELPPRPVLQRKLHDAVRMARARLEATREQAE